MTIWLSEHSRRMSDSPTLSASTRTALKLKFPFFRDTVLHHRAILSRSFSTSSVLEMSGTNYPATLCSIPEERKRWPHSCQKSSNSHISQFRHFALRPSPFALRPSPFALRQHLLTGVRQNTVHIAFVKFLHLRRVCSYLHKIFVLT